MTKKITKVVWWLVGIMIVGLIAGAILVGIGGYSDFWNESEGVTENIDEKKTFNSGEINLIDITTISEDVNIMPADSEEILVHIHGYYKMTPNREVPKIQASIKNGTLVLSVKKQQGWVFDLGVRDIDVDIYVPEEYEYVIKTTSGDMDVSDVEAGVIAVKTVSGDLMMQNIVAQELVFSSTSGDLIVKGIIGAGELDTVSGDLSVVTDTFDGGWDVEATSGDVKLDFPDDSSFKMDFESVSGDVSTEVPMTIEESSDHVLKGQKGDSDVLVRVYTISGDFRLN